MVLISGQTADVVLRTVNTEFGSYDDSIADLFNDTPLPQGDLSFRVRGFLRSPVLYTEYSLCGGAAAAGNGGGRHNRPKHSFRENGYG